MVNYRRVAIPQKQMGKVKLSIIFELFLKDITFFILYLLRSKLSHWSILWTCLHVLFVLLQFFPTGFLHDLNILMKLSNFAIVSYICLLFSPRIFPSSFIHIPHWFKCFPIYVFQFPICCYIFPVVSIPLIIFPHIFPHWTTGCRPMATSEWVNFESTSASWMP